MDVSVSPTMNPISLGNTEHFSLLASAGLGRLYEGEEKNWSG